MSTKRAWTTLWHSGAKMLKLSSGERNGTRFLSGISPSQETRSGKIMRRILRKIAEGDTSDFGDISTLLDTTVVERIVAGAEKLR